MEITLQYFDGCPNWTVAAARLAELAQDRPERTVTPFLVESPEQAEAIGFRGSPSILVNGADLFPDPAAPVGLACRIYATPDGLAGSPTSDQLRSALLDRMSAEDLREASTVGVDAGGKENAR